MSRRASLFLLPTIAAAFSVQQSPRFDTSLQAGAVDRRQVLWTTVAATLALEQSPSATADDTDLTTQLFNPDGSLKDETMEIEAKMKTIQFQWDRSSDTLLLHQDGQSSSPTGSQVKLSYDLPDKWAPGYMDRSGKACERITVYQASGVVNADRLGNAPTLGVGQALKVPESLQPIRVADLIGGRSKYKEGQKYYEFDMGVAPKTCGNSSENLGLGFCPFETIYLLSATVLDDRLYVLALESNKDEWKRANSDLKRVRSSFTVEA